MLFRPIVGAFLILAVVCGGAAAPARAELILSDLILELQADDKSRKDIEVWNNTDERSYVMITPAEIVDPGRPTERRLEEPDPEKLGLLVSPNRIILEPSQHKVIRIATISPAPIQDRIYRVTVKPVVGEVSGDQSGLKVLVGYDVLVIVRPSTPVQKVAGFREGRTLVLRNEGNTSAELLNGKQCNSRGHCVNLPGKRLYAGAEWRQALPSEGTVEYLIKGSEKIGSLRF